jgi:hypothetical protein
MSPNLHPISTKLRMKIDQPFGLRKACKWTKRDDEGERDCEMQRENEGSHLRRTTWRQRSRSMYGERVGNMKSLRDGNREK